MSNVTSLTPEEELKYIEMIDKIIRETADEQKLVLSLGKVERTFTSRLAHNIELALDMKNVTADPFYNKHLEDSKRLDGGIIELDIAVHKSVTDDYNLIAIELETSNSPKRDDVWKIEGLTDRKGQYGYCLGLFVVFGIKEKAGQIICQDWYRDGVIIRH